MPLFQRLAGALKGLGTTPAKAEPVVKAEIIERVRLEKIRQKPILQKYRDRPRIAFIIHSFNRIANIEQLIAGLRRLGGHEIIVCEDGSIDGSLEKWLSLLDDSNDFLIYSNDVHEIRATDRAIRFTNAEIICLVQDDDRIPGDRGWLDDTLERFDRYADLAIIGGFMGFASLYPFALTTLNPNDFHPDPKITTPLWGPGPFRLVQHVNVGPYFIRKKHYEALGGWDYAFSLVGEPGIGFECELCLRAWLNGYQVGYSFVPFKGPPGHYPLDGGTVLFGSKERRRNQLRNHERIFEMYAKHSRRIDQQVCEAGRRTGIQFASQALDLPG